MKFENEAVERVYKRFLTRDIKEVQAGGTGMCEVFMAGYNGDQARSPKRDAAAYGAYIAGKTRRRQEKKMPDDISGTAEGGRRIELAAAKKPTSKKKVALTAAPDTEKLREDAVASATGNAPEPRPKKVDGDKPFAWNETIQKLNEVDKPKGKPVVFEPVQTMKPLGDGEYRELSHEHVLAHIKVVKNEKVAAMFGSNKKSFGVFWGERLLGHIELTNGNVMWTASLRGGGTRQAKSPADAIYVMIQDGLEAAIKKEIGDGK